MNMGVVGELRFAVTVSPDGGPLLLLTWYQSFRFGDHS